MPSSWGMGLADRIRVALSPKEAAQAIGVSSSTLRRYMVQEGLPYSRVNGRVFLRIDRILAWLDEHEERPGQELERVLSLAGQACREVKRS